MKRSGIFLLLTLSIMLFSVNKLYPTDIYRLIDPVTGGSKSPNDGPPFLRFGNAQQYYHLSAFPSAYLNDVNTCFSKWNNAGTVQFSLDDDAGIPITVFTSNYRPPLPNPQIVNPGKSYVYHNNYIITTVYPSEILLNTHHEWGTVQRLLEDRFDVQTVLLHEIGHMHGLDHPLIDSYEYDATAPIMAGADNPYFWNNTARDLRTDDINGTRFLQYNTWVPQQCATIQAALTNSVSNCTIHINNGTYTENLTVGDKSNLTIAGQSSTNTIINGSLTAYYCNNLVINSLRCNNITAYYCNSSDYFCNSNSGGIALYSCTGFDQSGTITNCSTGLTASYSTGSVLSGSNYSSNGTSILSTGTGNVAVNFTRLCTSVNYDFEAAYYGYISSYASYFRDGNPRTYQHDGGTVSITYPMNCGMLKSSDAEGIQDNSLPDTQLQSDDPVEQEFSVINSSYFNLLKKIKEDNRKGISDNGELKNQSLNITNDFKSFIKKYPNSPLSRVALTIAATSHRLFSQEDGVTDAADKNKTFLDEIINDKELTSLKGAAEVLMIDNYSEVKDFNSAISQADAVINKYKEDSELSCDAMFKKGLLLSYVLKQQDKAADCFTAILKNYPDNPIAGFAENQLNRLGYDVQKNEGDVSLTDKSEFTSGAYPNPFNPSTTIRFNIPEEGKVIVKVFDILGREIAVLINEYMQTGSHNINWNGKDSYGSEVSSGVYFYNIRYNDQSMTKKLMLVR